MKKCKKQTKTDLQECRDKIRELLSEYNCTLVSADEWSNVFLFDEDTKKYADDLNKR